MKILTVLSKFVAPSLFRKRHAPVIISAHRQHSLSDVKRRKRRAPVC